MSALEEEVRRRLFELQDLKYKEFACKLMPAEAGCFLLRERLLYPRMREKGGELNG